MIAIPDPRSGDRSFRYYPASFRTSRRFSRRDLFPAVAASRPSSKAFIRGLPWSSARGVKLFFRGSPLPVGSGSAISAGLHPRRLTMGDYSIKSVNVFFH
jgi:hypothetical protein